MCTSSSEVNVGKIQTSARGDDGIGGSADGDGEESTILYAFPQDNTYEDTQEHFQSDTPGNGERLNPLQELISHCQVMRDSIRQLDRKLDIIDKKVSKIQRSRVKYCWYYHKPLGHHSSVSKKKAKKMKMMKRFGSLSHSESYSPTSPVRRQEYNGEENITMPSFPYEEEQEIKQEPQEEEQEQEQEPFGGSLSPSLYRGQNHPAYMRSDDMPGLPLSGSGSPRFSGRNNMSSADISSIAPSAPLTQRDPIPTRSLDRSNRSDCPDSKHGRSSFRNPSGCATSSPIEPSNAVLKQTLPEDPSNWSVEEVILFLNHTDPQISGALTHLLRQHEIDGKALLLLNSEMAVKYMGLKLGPSLKLCQHVEKLKEEKS